MSMTISVLLESLTVLPEMRYRSCEFFLVNSVRNQIFIVMDFHLFLS